MHHPYQCLAVARKHSGDILVAAVGPHILVFSIKNKELLSSWPEKEIAKDDQAQQDDSASSTEIITGSNVPGEDEPSKKKRKVARKAASGPSISPSTIARLVLTSDYMHVIATTGEDKSVHVLSLDETGQLKHLSQRHMPKRPCAVKLTPDNTHILCGDKFGDVYALPLHPPASDSDPSASKAAKPPPRVFKPSANELTIHSGRNKRALESQMKQGQTTKPKETMDFAHELLLGHVSMLTDLACATVKTSSGKTRSYILTSDRDEHIRVSRGMPQAHIIEGFCLGHKSFVSKICLLTTRLLVSGGGDQELYVWDWQKGELLFKLDLQRAVDNFWETQPKHTRHGNKTEQSKANDEEMMLQDSREAMGAPVDGNPDATQADKPEVEAAVAENTIAVSGLWAQAPSSDGIIFYCALEGIPAVFKFKALDLEATKAHDCELEALQLPGNPLDLAILADGTAIVAVDNVHEAGSTKLAATTENFKTPRLHIASGSSACRDALEVINTHDSLQLSEDTDVAYEQQKKLGELFYGAENLRKRGGWGGEQEAE